MPLRNDPDQHAGPEVARDRLPLNLTEPPLRDVRTTSGYRSWLARLVPFVNSSQYLLYTFDQIFSVRVTTQDLHQ
jgi:hypothetical protein